jgi:hypothetical protein
MMTLGWLVCKIKGHKRGKRVMFYSASSTAMADRIEFRCPRCLATWTRKAKVKANT